MEFNSIQEGWFSAGNETKYESRIRTMRLKIIFKLKRYLSRVYFLTRRFSCIPMIIEVSFFFLLASSHIASCKVSIIE